MIATWLWSDKLLVVPVSVEELFKRIWGVGKYTAKKLQLLRAREHNKLRCKLHGFLKSDCRIYYIGDRRYEPPNNLRTIADIRAAVANAQARGDPPLLDRRAMVRLLDRIMYYSS